MEIEMSALKNQLRLILPGLSKEANANQDREIKRHLYLLKAVCASKKTVKQACEARGVSTDQFYSWGRRLLKARSLEALRSRSRKPKHSPRQTAKRVERKIAALRNAEPSHGPERISFDLKRLFKIDCPPSTVYNVLKRLGLITKAYREKLTKKHLKRYRRPLPGYLQMDVKYVPYRINGEQYYEFNVVDHCTSWRLLRAYRRLTHESLVRFLSELEDQCPFPIIEIQTDNGVEFTDKYQHGRLKPSGLHPLDLWCSQRGVVHRLIPVGQKELNGKVENTHKQDDREFYASAGAGSYEQIARQMRSYNERWNHQRATKGLGWKTPAHCVEEGYVRAMAYLAILNETYRKSPEPFYQFNSAGDACLWIQKAKPLPRNSGGRLKKTALDRYLQWHDWDRKKSFKALFSMPLMYQDFPVFLQLNPLCSRRCSLLFFRRASLFGS